MSKEPYGVVYRITCLVNGKCYHGQTVNPKERWPHHLRGDSHCHALRNAVRKYGRENFVFEVVATAFSKEELDFCEEAVVATSIAPKGYNLKRGGANGKLSVETRRKMSKVQKVVQNLPDVKARNSEGVKRAWARLTPEMKRKRGLATSLALNRPEVRSRRSQIMMEVHARPGQKALRSASLRANWASYTPAERSARIEKQRIALRDPAYLAHMRVVGKSTMSRPEVKEKHKAAIRRAMTPEHRAKVSETMKKLHSTPGFSYRVGKAISKAHNTPEGKAKLARRRRRGEQLEAWKARVEHMDQIEKDDVGLPGRDYPLSGHGT